MLAGDEALLIVKVWLVVGPEQIATAALDGQPQRLSEQAVTSILTERPGAERAAFKFRVARVAAVRTRPQQEQWRTT
jgi:hypothetical protein